MCVPRSVLNNPDVTAASVPGMTEVLLSWKYWWPLHPAQRVGINRPCVKRFTHSFTSRLQFHPLGRCLTHVTSTVDERGWRWRSKGCRFMQNVNVNEAKIQCFKWQFNNMYYTVKRVLKNIKAYKDYFHFFNKLRLNQLQLSILSYCSINKFLYLT